MYVPFLATDMIRLAADSAANLFISVAKNGTYIRGVHMVHGYGTWVHWYGTWVHNIGTIRCNDVTVTNVISFINQYVNSQWFD